VRRPLLLLIPSLILFVLTPPAHAAEYTLEVGALSHAGSSVNMGVQVEIRSHLYPVYPPEADSFWVGSVPSDGAFIQFGYILKPAGSYCSSAEMVAGLQPACLGEFLTVNGSEPMWFWQYWPNAVGDTYYYGSGMPRVGTNGTWHVYSIMPDSNGKWSFKLDEQEVASTNFQSANSSQLAFVAEKTFDASPTFSRPGPLGPVEFRNLAYLDQNGWRPVTDLYAIINCGVNSECMPIPYGVALLSANHIIAGTSVPQPKDGELLWSNVARSAVGSGPVPTTSQLEIDTPMNQLYLGLAAIFLAIILALWSGGRRSRKSREKNNG
jgi:hypothetical protein